MRCPPWIAGAGAAGACLALAAVRAAARPGPTELDAAQRAEDGTVACVEGSDCGADLSLLQRRGRRVARGAAAEAGDLRVSGKCREYTCHQHYHSWMACQCNPRCRHFGNCCPDFNEVCDARESGVGGGGKAPATGDDNHNQHGSPYTAPSTTTDYQQDASPSSTARPLPDDSQGGYRLDWKAQGTSFFDQWEFLWNDDNHGSAEYLLELAAQEAGVVQAHPTHAILTAGKASPKYQWKRQTAKMQTKKSWRYFLAAMRYSHLPYGCGVWPAFFTLGKRREWPEGGEFDILEYVNMDVSKSSIHMGPGCTLEQQAMEKYGGMPDRNQMGYDCQTDYAESKLGCAPNKWMRTGEQWSNRPGVVALEWTEEHIKMFAIPEGEIPADLDADEPDPDQWDKWVFSYYPLNASGCTPDMFDPQRLLLQINFCGDWASKVWNLDGQCKAKVKGCRSVDPLAEYAPKADCCTQFIWDEDGHHGTDGYLKERAFFNMSYLKVFTQ